MKRVIILALVTLFMASAVAEGIDLTSMTDEELYSLQESVHNEMASRELVGSEISTGVYVVGKDIRPGSWTLRCIGDRLGGTCFVFDSEDSLTKFTELVPSPNQVIPEEAYSVALESYILRGDSIINLSLSDGMVFRLLYVNAEACIIEEANKSFAP